MLRFRQFFLKMHNLFDFNQGKSFKLGPLEDSLNPEFRPQCVTATNSLPRAVVMEARCIRSFRRRIGRYGVPRVLSWDTAVYFLDSDPDPSARWEDEDSSRQI